MGKPTSDADQDLVRLYLDGIGRYPLLTQEDEVRLAQAVEEGRRAATRLAQGTDGMDPAEVGRLRRQQRAGERAFEQFVNSNLRLVVSIAKRYQGDLPMLDLVQEGNIGLMHAVEKFDWRRGYKFSTYATWWIRQAIGRGIDNTARTVRLPIHTGDQVRRVMRARSALEGRLGRTPTAAELAEHAGIKESDVETLLKLVMEPVSLASPIGSDGDTELADVMADESAPSPFDAVAMEMLGDEVEKLMARLGERERRILSLRFGLDRGEPRTLDEVGTEMHLTRERIRQIERAALAKLRSPAAEEAARDLLAS
ncbi:MAG TPA: sigma-70 family RNA polymerase sigma factor [Acidimicrobiales bacterium]|nr:sigma-70 family RNA polymerase sigma factor [Acidimicrobiales bacterium]